MKKNFEKFLYIYIYIIIKVARLSVKSSMKTQSIKLNYKSHKRDFIKTSTVCFAFLAHQEVILIQIESIQYIYIYISFRKLILLPLRLSNFSFYLKKILRIDLIILSKKEC